MDPSARKPVICVGAVFWETIFRVDHIPGRGIKLLPQDARQLASGMAPAAAATIARLGHPVALWSVLGDDVPGAAARLNLAQAGIDVQALIDVAGGQTPFSSVLVDAAGERLVVPFFDPALYGPSALAKLPLHHVAQAAAVLADMRWVAGAEAALRAARAHGVPAVLDADLAPLEALQRLLPLADHVLFSELALELVVPGLAPAEALAQMAARLPDAVVIGVTLGERGALAWQRDGDDDGDDCGGGITQVPGIAVRAVDTLNAGDVWHGAYVHALVGGLGLAERIRFANVAAALKCERPWGRLGAPSLAEVQARLAPSLQSR